MQNLSSIQALLLVMQFADSALPIGGFSFSGGLESAAAHGVVYDVHTLKVFLNQALRRAAFSDGVAALTAHRSIERGARAEAFEADRRLGLFKAGDENRRMSLRMGRKLCELVAAIAPRSPFQSWVEALNGSEKGESIEGHYATTLGALYATLGLDRKALFATLMYGLAGQITGAALRLLRIDHLTVRRLLFELGPAIENLYEEVEPLNLNEMQQFSPELEILASLHEYGQQRMFMN